MSDGIGDDDETVQASTNAVMEGVKQQLAHELSEERGLELKAEDEECLASWLVTSANVARLLCLPPDVPQLSPALRPGDESWR